MSFPVYKRKDMEKTTKIFSKLMIKHGLIKKGWEYNFDQAKIWHV